MSPGDMAVTIVSVLVGLATLLGIGIRFGLVPYIERVLIRPLLVDLTSLVRLADDTHKEMQQISKMWDHHLEWSQKEVDMIWERLRSMRAG